MAYADQGSMTFLNVNVAAAGTYEVSFRYAFASGLFPGVNDREMGLSVNGQVVVDPMHFPITGSFERYMTPARHGPAEIRRPERHLAFQHLRAWRFSGGHHDGDARVNHPPRHAGGPYWLSGVRRQ